VEGQAETFWFGGNEAGIGCLGIVFAESPHRMIARWANFW
jgi:hypothetical protein